MTQEQGLRAQNTAIVSKAQLAGFARALGWAIVFLVLFFAVAFAWQFVGAWVGHNAWHGLSLLTRVAIEIGGVLLITWLLRIKLNKKTWAGMALPRPQLGLLLLGCGCGLLAILAVFGSEYLLGWLHITRVSMQPLLGLPRIGAILLLLLPALGTGFGEELAFRGYIFQTLAEHAPVWVAALLTGVFFALAHFSKSGFDVAFVVSTIGGSVMFVIMRFATGSLWFPIGFHALWDWTQTFLVGLSTTGSAHDPALIQISQSGPAFWVGGGNAIESGFLYMFAWFLALILALVYGKRVGRTPPWMQRISADGRALQLG